MPRKKTDSKKYYLVLSKSKNYTFGAFPYTEEGRKKAEAFVKKTSKQKNEELYIQAK